MRRPSERAASRAGLSSPSVVSWGWSAGRRPSVRTDRAASDVFVCSGRARSARFGGRRFRRRSFPLRDRGSCGSPRARRQRVAGLCTGQLALLDSPLGRESAQQRVQGAARHLRSGGQLAGGDARTLANDTQHGPPVRAARGPLASRGGSGGASRRTLSRPRGACPTTGAAALALITAASRRARLPRRRADAPTAGCGARFTARDAADGCWLERPRAPDGLPVRLDRGALPAAGELSPRPRTTPVARDPASPNARSAASKRSCSRTAARLASKRSRISP